MHTQATRPQPAATTAPPLSAATECPHCGRLPAGAPHRAGCFPSFQAELLRAYPALQDAVSLREAEAIERIFRFWTGMIHTLSPRSPSLADTCVERRWWETSGYVERLLARHARRSAICAAPEAAAS